MEKVTAIIGDLVDSRKYKDRERVQKRLIYSIKYLNQCFDKFLVKQVEVSSGDSIQGLFNDTSMSFLYVRMLQMMMTPIKLRVGIGFGDIEYIDDTYTSNMLDGSAYHNARYSLDIVDSVKDNIIYLAADIDSNVILNTANGALKMYYQIKNKQSNKSNMIQLMYELINPLSLDGSINYLIDDVFIESIYAGDWEIIDIASKEDIVTKLNNKNQSISVMNISENESILSSLQYKTRGTADKIASITGTTRQNVQKFISKDIQDDVLNAITIVNYLKEVFS